jgi:hypothetical protein
MSTPFVAILGPLEPWNATTHARQDLRCMSMRIEQAESELARLTIETPDIDGLAGQRLCVSDRGRLLFDGVVTYVPRGVLGAIYTVEAVARPPSPEALDTALATLAESLKVAPFWDGLFVPQGRESDWAEILAARSQVLAHSRIQGAPSVCDALGGSTTIAVKPFDQSVSYDIDAAAASTYRLRMTAKWKQLALQQFTDGNALANLTSFTPDGLKAEFPKVGAEVAAGFRVTAAKMEPALAFGRPDIAETVDLTANTSTLDELDPAWTTESVRLYRFLCQKMETDLRVEYRYEIARTETAVLALNAGIQSAAIVQQVEEETLDLRDLAEAETRPAWRPNRSYTVGQEVVDGRYVYVCRVAHTSGRTRTAAEWSQSGESSYVASRSYASWWRSPRGAAALAHAAERIKARARLAARCVRVSFEAAMPSPWRVTHDMTVSMASPRLPGGSAEGRLVSYALTWDRGRLSFSGTIACAVGLGGSGAVSVDTPPDLAPRTAGRLDVSVEYDGEEQKDILEAAQGMGTITTFDLPDTKITIQATPAAATSFEWDVTVPTSGTIAIPEQVNI